MNTHDIGLPPLPEWVDWPVTVSEMSASEIKEAMQAYARAAIEADRKRRGEPVAWHPIDTAPHNETVLLGWRDWDGEWMAEVCMASWGWRTDRVSNISKHGQATHWMPIPPQPAGPVKRKRPYAQGSALGEFGVIPMCDQVDDEPVKVPSVADRLRWALTECGVRRSDNGAFFDEVALGKLAALLARYGNRQESK